MTIETQKELENVIRQYFRGTITEEEAKDKIFDILIEETNGLIKGK